MASKVSWATDLSPTASFTQCHGAATRRLAMQVGEGCTRGGEDWGGPGGVLPGYYQGPTQDPYLAIFSLRTLPMAK